MYRGATLLLSAAVSIGILSSAGASTLTEREQVQHLLRRFAYSAPPAQVDTLAASPSAASAWLKKQLNPSSIDDSAVVTDPLPTSLNYSWDLFDRILIEHSIGTKRQVQAKLELHWLDHFSVSLDKVGDPAQMWHYDNTIRANALGNFTTLTSAVAQEAAMMVWLDNNGNVGPVANENYARESMQLFIMGPFRLNQDGSYKLDAKGQPIPNYSQEDVQAIAKAITGYYVNVKWKSKNPLTRFSVDFVPGNHVNIPLKFQGKTYTVPNDDTALNYVTSLLTHNPSTAPFQAKELLQRFVTETPSPKYISDIAAVWTQTVDSPTQIAQVVNAIVTNPEFDAGYHSMVKQPMELVLDMARIMPMQLQSAGGNGRGSNLIWTLSDLDQEPFYPPSVFSFYRPGAVETMVNTSTRLNRMNDLAWIDSVGAANSGATSYINIATLREQIGSAKSTAIADYLLDALDDGGTPALRTILLNYLDSTSKGDKPSDQQIRGAIWLLINSADYAVN